MRTLLRAAGMAAVVTVTSIPAGATGIPVFDASTFGQALVSANQAVRQVANQLTQIDQQVTMIANQARSLETLGPERLDALATALAGQTAPVQGLLGRVQGIGFGLGGVEAELDALFPAGTAGPQPVAAHAEQYRRWSAQLLDASRTAMAGQAAIGAIQAHAAEARTLLALSGGADGEVRQLQAVNGMLSVLAGQLGDATTTIAATGRVTASAAAVAQAERDTQRALMRRFTAPVNIPINNGQRF